MLDYNPSTRITPAEALEHGFFTIYRDANTFIEGSELDASSSRPPSTTATTTTINASVISTSSSHPVSFTQTSAETHTEQKRTSLTPPGTRSINGVEPSLSSGNVSNFSTNELQRRYANQRIFTCDQSSQVSVSELQ